MKQIDVTIMGQSYVLGCPEGGEHGLLDAVRQVDREMCGIRDAGKVRARERIAVLAALNLAYRLGQQATGSAVAAPNGAAVKAPLQDGNGAAHSPTADLQALIARIDETLAQDGQLL